MSEPKSDDLAIAGEAEDATSRPDGPLRAKWSRPALRRIDVRTAAANPGVTSDGVGSS